jgi:glycosidase
VRRSGRRGLHVVLAVLAAALLAGAAGEASGKPKPRPNLPKAPAGAALQAIAAPPARTSLASQRIYFVMTDRYANGDPSNDRAGLSGSRDVTGYDPTDPGFFHGGDLRGLTGTCNDPQRGLARIKGLGFTAIWVTPPVAQKYVQGTSAAYHGYWGRDFTTVDPHLGTDADFADFVSCAHSLGLKVFMDVVVNHTADIVQLSNPSYVGPAQAPWKDCNGRTFDPARYVRGTFPCLSAQNMPRRPSVPSGDQNRKAPDWLNDPTRYHDRGDIDFGGCDEICFEQGDFFGLDDLFTEQPAVVDGLADIYGSWIRRYKLDGFRIDTARHVNRAFFGLWIPKILAAAREAGVPDFQLFGEVFINDTSELSAFVRDRGLPNVLDFPMQDAFTRFASGSAGPLGVVARLQDDDYFETPAAIEPTPPTFLGNHDMGRAAYRIQSVAHVGPDELLRRDLLGHDLMYLLRGAPVVLYGDEVGLMGRGGDQQARQDLFPTQVDEWRDQERVGAPPIGSGSAFDVANHPISERLRVLGALRDAHPALSTGATVVRRTQGKLLAVSRIDADGRHEYLAVFNGGTDAARLAVPTSTPSSSWAPLLGASATVSSNASGAVTVAVPGISSLLFRADAQLPVRRPARPTVAVGRAALGDFWQVRAGVAGAAPVSVGFAVRRAGGRAWQRLAADDSPPYRAFVDPARFRRNERIHLMAVARGLDGRTAVSKVVPFTVRR